jgi:AraC-like DNA-binding protein/ligand-binding sensor protein
MFNTLNDFSSISGVGVIVIDRSGVEQFRSSLYRETQPCLDYVARLLKVREKCKNAEIHSGEIAFRYGNRYVFLCPRNFVFFSSPILLRGEHHLTAIGGPLLMKSHSDYIGTDIENRVAAFDRSGLLNTLSAIPVVKPAIVNMLSEQLFVNTVHLSDNMRGEASDMSVNRLREYFETYVYGREKHDCYAERKLVNTLSIMENMAAKSLLNEILGHILFHSGKNIEFVKMRVIELISILSDTAIRDGAEIKAISDITYSYSKKIYEIDGIDGIIVWLNDILDEFAVFSLNDPSGKHASALCDTLNYINRNYNRRLRLEDLAKRIYVSPTHFSTLFKAETGYGFKEYLNKVRIEQSKILMQNLAISLADIAGMVGFSDQSYFTRVFKKQEGKSPNHYRNRILNKR